MFVGNSPEEQELAGEEGRISPQQVGRQQVRGVRTRQILPPGYTGFPVPGMKRKRPKAKL
jgi:hypothetical protein